MRVFLEVDEACDVYHVKGSSFSKRRCYGTFQSVLYEHLPLTLTSHNQPKDVFLLHERAFDYADFKVVLSSRTPFSVTELKRTVHEKIVYMKEMYGFDSPYCKYRLRHGQVDGMPTPYILGKRGDIGFHLQFFSLKDKYLRTFKKYLPERLLAHAGSGIYPRSLFLLDSMERVHPTPDVIFLSLFERTCQLIRCSSGRYAHVDEIPMGESFLKSCYAEHNITDYMYHDQQSIEQNTLLKKLITESVLFYNQQLVRRISQYVLPGQGLLLLGNPIKNHLFVETFQATYVDFLGGFVLPMASLPGAHKYGHPQPSDISFLAYLAHSVQHM